MDELELLGQELVESFKKDGIEFTKSQMNKIADVLPKALALAAKRTETPIDDAVVAAIGEPLKSIVKDLINKI